MRLTRNQQNAVSSLIGQFPEENRPDGGLQPGILVVPTVSDITRGRDAEMDPVKTQARPMKPDYR